MRWLFSLVLVLLATVVLAASYTDAEAAQHEGETAEVHGKVSDVHVFDSGMVLINFGAKYPGQNFTAVIYKNKASAFPEPKKYQGATLSIHGAISMHKGKPQIALESPTQIKVLAEAGVTPAPVPEEPLGTVVGPDGRTRNILPTLP